MRSIGDAAKAASDETVADDSHEAAGFSLPFGWGKKKDAEKDQPTAPSAETPQPAPVPPVVAAPKPAPPPAPAAKPDRIYKVKSGDTLWDIATHFYGDGQQYRKIANANKIADPNMIDVGWELKIPQ